MVSIKIVMIFENKIFSVELNFGFQKRKGFFASKNWVMSTSIRNNRRNFCVSKMSFFNQLNRLIYNQYKISSKKHLQYGLLNN